jgi:hypothetical protein
LAHAVAFKAQRGEEGQACSGADRAAGTEQGARDLLELRERRVALERLRERRGARVADLIELQAAARRGGSVMLMIYHTGPPTQDLEHDSLETRLPGLKPRDRVAHDLF